MSLWQFNKMAICTFAVLIMLIALMHIAMASECEDISKLMPKGEGCSDSSGWDPTAKLDQIGTGQGDQVQSSSDPKWPQKSRQYRWNETDLSLDNSGTTPNSGTMPNTGSNGSIKAAGGATLAPGAAIVKPINEPTVNIKPKRSSKFNTMMAPVSNTSQFDVILDVSPDTNAEKFIPGAVHIDYKKFQENGTLKPAPELARLLGDAGITSNNSILIYGECECPLGPTITTYVYWALRYLGHNPEKIRVLDGGIRDWTDANNTAVNQSQSLPKANYTFLENPIFLATYEGVRDDKPQLVDARMPQDFGTESILDSINIPFERMMTNRIIKSEFDLEKIFSSSLLRKDRPVVVYSGEGVQASMVWFALEILGYNAKLYTWNDWLMHKRPLGNVSN